MEGQCKERPGVEEAEGGRRERPEQVVTTPPLQTDIVAGKQRQKKITKCDSRSEGKLNLE